MRRPLQLEDALQDCSKRLRGHSRLVQRLHRCDACSARCDGIRDAVPVGMVGFITERNFEQAELEFPGIVALFEALPVKPATFLELLQRYLADTMPNRQGLSSRAHDIH